MEYDLMDAGGVSACAPDAPDYRDMTLDSDEAETLLRYIKHVDDGVNEAFVIEGMPLKRELTLRGSAADACCSLLEYYRSIYLGDTQPLSRSFLHSTTAMLNAAVGLEGVSLRTVLNCVRRCGIPPQSLVTALERRGGQAVDTPLCYQFNDYANDLFYCRIDPTNYRKALSELKVLLRAGIPCLFSMSITASTVYDRSGSENKPIKGSVEVFGRFDGVLGLRAGVLCGFSDEVCIDHLGSLRFFGPFGSDWGDEGLGWMSYSMLQRRMIADIWVPMSRSWLAEMTAPYPCLATSGSHKIP
ncbi:MAG: hypothetical protein U0892_04345 [Pirellulales bacterium]